MKKVIITTVDTRKFIQDVLELGKQGGVLTDECRAYKGIVYIAEVMVPENVVVNTSERVKLDPNYVAAKTLEQEKPEVVEEEVLDLNKVYTQEELEALTIKQVRDITGGKGRNKAEMIKSYLEAQETPETEE